MERHISAPRIRTGGACSALNTVLGRRVAAVVLSDGQHDGEPEPGASIGAGAGFVGATEPLEGQGQELGWEARALVGDLDSDRGFPARVIAEIAEPGGA